MSGTIPTGAPGTGMISSATPFVSPDLTPAPLSFRFLFELWKDLGNHEQRIATLEAKLGVTDGSDATAGQIGEYLTASASAVLVTTTPTDVVTLTLSAGDWDVDGSAVFSPSVGNLSFMDVWLSTAANTSADPGRSSVQVLGGTLGVGSMVAGPLRFSSASSAVAHLGCQANFASGTVTATGWIRARRVR